MTSAPTGSRRRNAAALLRVWEVERAESGIVRRLDCTINAGYSSFLLYVVSAFRRTLMVRLKPDTTYF
jgi:hypothetical protein